MGKMWGWALELEANARSRNVQAHALFAVQKAFRAIRKRWRRSVCGRSTQNKGVACA